MRNVEQLFAPGEQGGQIVDRLLATHCTQVEERELMLLAIPRMLTQELLGRILNLSDAEARSRWQHYHHQPFLLFSEDPQRMTFLPGVRVLFLKKLQLTTPNANDTDYDRTHRLLCNYFNDLIRQQGTQDERNLQEYNYHSLALGEYEPVIEWVCTQRKRPDRWLHLLQVIEESPTQRLPRSTVEQQAADALDQARLHTDAKEATRAIVLYTWLLHRADPDTRRDMAAYCNQRAIELVKKPELPPQLQASTQSLTPAPQALQVQTPLKQRAWQFSRGLYRGVLSSRRAQGILAVVLIITVILLLLLPYLYRPQAPPVSSIADNPFAFPLAQLQPGIRNQWIGTTIEPDNEFIGLSDGSIPFDYLRPDASLKVRAASELRSGHLNTARDLFQQAVQNDINDAEAFIYLENVQIRLSGKPCTVFVVATRIIEEGGEGVNNGRDNLQGAYVAQKEYNDAHAEKQLCLYIANIGNDSGYAPIVARQIVQAAAANKAIEGLIGWPGLFDSSASLGAVNQLQAAHIPIISPDGYDEVQYAPNVFHVAPSYQAQGRRAARYAENVLTTMRAVVITDPTDPYSRGLTEGFKEQFQRDDHQIVGIQTYTTGHTDAQAFATNLHSLLTANPAFIYFAGGLVEGQVLLAQLRGLPLPILGGDALYSFVGFSVNTRPDFERLAFTSPAYSDAPTAQYMKDLYALAFDSQGPNLVREYGYRRPDSQAILSYDAMETLITGHVDASGLQNLQQALSSVSVKGASRPLITFTPINELNDQSLFVLFVDQQERIRFTVV